MRYARQVPLRRAFGAFPGLQPPDNRLILLLSGSARFTKSANEINGDNGLLISGS
jgi:hypothetical protein